MPPVAYAAAPLDGLPLGWDQEWTDAGNVNSPPERRSGPPSLVVKATAPLAWALAGRPWFPLWAVVQHRGRKSGKRYPTPVAIIPTRSDATLLIGLPWGRSTDWAQNVLAAGGATLTWKGHDVTATNPRLVGREIAVEQAKPLIQRIVGSGRFSVFLQLDRREP